MSTVTYTTVRLKEATRQVLRDLARAEGTSMQEVLDLAIEDLRRKRFLEQVNQDFAQLRADDKAWAAERAERRIWDATLLDGLPRDEQPVVRESGAPRKRRRKES